MNVISNCQWVEEGNKPIPRLKWQCSVLHVVRQSHICYPEYVRYPFQLFLSFSLLFVSILCDLPMSVACGTHPDVIDSPGECIYALVFCFPLCHLTLDLIHSYTCPFPIFFHLLSYLHCSSDSSYLQSTLLTL